MTAPLAIRAGVVWTAGGGDLLADLPAAVRARAERIERPGALALGAAGRLGLPMAGATVRRDLGVSVGTALGCFATNVAYQHRLAAHGAAGASPRLFAATVSNAAAGEVGIAHGLGGPALTVTAGATAGLAALAAAGAEVTSGAARGMLVAALDVVDDAGRRWLRASGWPDDTPAEQVAALVLGDEPSALPEWGRLGAVALGRAGEGDVGIRLVAERALAEARVSGRAVRVRATRRRDVERIRVALEVLRVEAPSAAPPLLAAGGLAGVLAALAGEAAPVLVVDCCPSGLVAAAVAWSAPA